MFGRCARAHSFLLWADGVVVLQSLGPHPYYRPLAQLQTQLHICHTCRLLCEVHEEYRTNIRLANQGYWV